MSSLPPLPPDEIAAEDAGAQSAKRKRLSWRRWWSALPDAERRARALDDALRRLSAADEAHRLIALRALIAAVRPARPQLASVARGQLVKLTQRMRENPGERAALRDALLWLIGTRQPLRLLTESGVLPHEGLLTALWRRMTDRLLPEEWRPEELKDCLHFLFDDPRDYLWVDAVEDTVWVALLDALDFSAAASDVRPTMTLPILEALQVVSYRVAAIGLEPELVRNHAAIERYESPFLTQNVELHAFLEERKKAALDQREPTVDDKHLMVLLGQCEEIVGKVRKQAAQSGASISLTVLLARLTQNIKRLQRLLRLLEVRPVHELNEMRLEFFRQVVRAENRRHSVTELWAQAADLLSTRIVSNASKAGEQYITSTRAEFFALFRSAMGAGFIVVLASLTKIALFSDTRSPVGQALVYSAVYAVAFILMYVFHFSLATKQPAMTANAIAQTLEGNADSAGKRLAALTELVVRTFRSQFIALVGNLIVVLPLAWGVVTIYNWRTGLNYLDAHKAERLLSDVQPLSPHVWIWAALTGVCLFATGLISGYYDNRAVYDRVPQRVAQARWIRRLLGRNGAARLGTYIENNLGGLMGSLLFGIMLGSVGAVGRTFGLPIDTLHVTFTSANSVYALAATEAPSAAVVLPVVAAVCIIGLLNLLVSFSLALWVATRAQRVRFDAGRALLNEVVRRFLRRPLDFFWPPRMAPVSTRDDGKVAAGGDQQPR